MQVTATSTGRSCHAAALVFWRDHLMRCHLGCRQRRAIHSPRHEDAFCHLLVGWRLTAISEDCKDLFLNFYLRGSYQRIFSFLGFSASESRRKGAYANLLPRLPLFLQGSARPQLFFVRIVGVIQFDNYQLSHPSRKDYPASVRVSRSPNNLLVWSTY